MADIDPSGSPKNHLNRRLTLAALTVGVIAIVLFSVFIASDRACYSLVRIHFFLDCEEGTDCSLECWGTSVDATCYDRNGSVASLNNGVLSGFLDPPYKVEAPDDNLTVSAPTVSPYL